MKPGSVNVAIEAAGESPTGEVCSVCGVELTIMPGTGDEAALWCGCGALVILN